MRTGSARAAPATAAAPRGSAAPASAGPSPASSVASAPACGTSKNSERQMSPLDGRSVPAAAKASASSTLAGSSASSASPGVTATARPGRSATTPRGWRALGTWAVQKVRSLSPGSPAGMATNQHSSISSTVTPAASSRAISAQTERGPTLRRCSTARQGSAPAGRSSRMRPKRHGSTAPWAARCGRSASSASSACRLPSTSAGSSR